jgi:hypothetical protein
MTKKAATRTTVEDVLASPLPASLRTSKASTVEEMVVALCNRRIRYTDKQGKEREGAGIHWWYDNPSLSQFLTLAGVPNDLKIPLMDRLVAQGKVTMMWFGGAPRYLPAPGKERAPKAQKPTTDQATKARKTLEAAL